MNHNEQILRNLYAELNMMLVKFDETERAYHEAVAQVNALNEKIIAQKKLIDNDYLLRNEIGME